VKHREAGVEYAAEERNRAFGLNFMFGGEHCDEILISLGGQLLGEKFEVNFWGGLHE
jgi:hypothetical protein